MKKDVVKCSVNFWLFSLFRVWLGNMKRFSNSFNYYTIYWLCFVFLKKSFSYFTFFVNNLLLSVFIKENMALNFHSHWLFFLTYVSFCKFSFFAKFLSSRVGQWNNIVKKMYTIRLGGWMGMGRDGGLYVYALRLLAYLYKRSLQISLFRSRPAFRNNWRQEFFDLFPSNNQQSSPYGRINTKYIKC